MHHKLVLTLRKSRSICGRPPVLRARIFIKNKVEFIMIDNLIQPKVFASQRFRCILQIGSDLQEVQVYVVDCKP